MKRLFIVIYSVSFLLFLTRPVQADEETVQIVGVRDHVTSIGQTIDYKDGISVIGEGLSVEQLLVDASQVNLNEPGTYYVYYFIEGIDTVNEKARVVVLDAIQNDNEEALKFDSVPNDFLIMANSTNPDYLRTITAWDGDLEITDQIKYVTNVDLNQVGEYDLVYYVSTNNGQFISKTVTIKVVSEDANNPELLGIPEGILTLPVHEKYDFFKDVQAYDKEWGVLTNVIDVDTGDFDIHHLGEYTITYRVKDGSDKETHATLTVQVVDDEKPNIVPKKNLSFKRNTTPQLADFFTVTDNYDNLLDLDVIFVDSNVDMSKVGSYLLKVKVSDQAGNTTINDFIVYVYDVEEAKFYENPFILGSVVAILTSLLVNFGISITKKRNVNRGY